VEIEGWEPRPSNLVRLPKPLASVT
jgi:hypothetical protein